MNKRHRVYYKAKERASRRSLMLLYEDLQGNGEDYPRLAILETEAHALLKRLRNVVTP